MTIETDPYPILETDRLWLRALEVNDAEALFKLRADESVNRYLGRPPAVTINDALAFIDKIAKVSANKQGIYWVITLKNTAEFVGTICLWNFNTEKNMAELGYELMPDHQGKGIMNEAMQAVIGYSFEKLQLKILSAITHPDNEASSNLLKRKNFVLDKVNEFVSEEDAEGLDAYVLNVEFEKITKLK